MTNRVKTEQLIDRLNRHISQMSPNHKERDAGRLLIEATIALERLQHEFLNSFTTLPEQFKRP